MYVEDLFYEKNIKCPNWLKKIYLEEKWMDSNYEYKNGVHYWFIKNNFEDLNITFDGKELHFKAFNEKGILILDNIYTEMEVGEC